MIAALAAAVENGMVVGAADVFERQHESIPEAAHQHALAVASASVTFGGDLGTELFEVDEELDAAIAQDDAELVGRIVLAVRQALVETLAARGRCPRPHRDGQAGRRGGVRDVEGCPMNRAADTAGRPEGETQASFYANPIPFKNFTTVVPDDALAPNAPRGTRLIFKRGGVPEPGHGVLVEDRSGQRYIRRYAEGRDGAWIAEAVNPAYASFDSVADGLTLLATMTGRCTSSVDLPGGPR